MTETDVEKKKMGTGAKVAIGCGSGCLVVVLLVVVAVVAGVFYVKNFIGKYETDLKGHGFEKVTSGQMIEVTELIAEPTLFKGLSVRIMSDCSTNLAVLAQACEIYGRIDGKLYFRGQMLTLHPGSEVLGGIDAQAQVLHNKGKVEGGISGEYQLLEPNAAPK